MIDGRAGAPAGGPACLVAGASGLVGRELVQLLAASTTPLLLLTRRPLPPDVLPRSAPALRVLQVNSLSAPGPLPPLSMAFITLGTTLAQAGSREAFRAVDLDTVLAVARAAAQAGARRLAVVSSLGADPKSGNFYQRVKGEMEAALTALDFERLVIARPSLLDGQRSQLGQPGRPAEAAALCLLRPLARWLPASLRPIPARAVARAMIHALVDDTAGAVRILSSADMIRLSDINPANSR